MKHGPALEVNSLSYSRTCLPSAEPESSVLCPQQFDIGPLLVLNPVPTIERDFHTVQFTVPPSMPESSKTVSSLELFEPKLLCAFLIYPIRATCPAHHFLLNLTILIYLERCTNYAVSSSLLATQISLSIIREFYFYLFCLRDMYSPFRPLVIFL
jgi:hypothetical protein